MIFSRFVFYVIFGNFEKSRQIEKKEFYTDYFECKQSFTNFCTIFFVIEKFRQIERIMSYVAFI